tara:strand:+ start:460 stop:2697 length:2238 start_codon:yes stop_codon:yes gene_type:complete
MNFINTIIPINFYLIALPFLFTSGKSDHNREILSQSRAQQAVGKTIQSSIEDLEALIADLESNGLIQDDMAEKMYSARLVLNQLNSNNIPEAVSRLRAAAIGSAGRSGNLQEATKEIDIILGELKKTAKDVGNEQKRAAYEQMLTQLFSDSEKLQEQTLKWGEEQLLSPDLADLSKQSALEKQSEIESQMDAFKDMLKNEITKQNDLSMKQELEDVLDSLEGFEMDQSANDQTESSDQDLPEFDLMPEQEANPEGENFADLQNPDPSKMFQQELATNQFNQTETKNSSLPFDPTKKEEPTNSPEGNTNAGNEDTSATDQANKGKLPEKMTGSSETGEDIPLKDQASNEPNETVSNQETTGENNFKKEESVEGEKGQPNQNEPKNAADEKDHQMASKETTSSLAQEEVNQRPRENQSGNEKNEGRLEKASNTKNNEKVENTQESESKNEEMVKKNKQNAKDISAEKALEKSADAMASNDPSSALEAQKDFQERIQQALQAMGSMMAQNTLEPINEENVSNANMSLSPSALGAFDEAAMSLDEEDLFDEMSFGNQSGGSEIGDADLEALLSGESEEELGGAGDGSGQGEESQNDENSLASSNSSQSGKSSSGQNADQQKTNQNNKNNQNQPGQQMAQSSGGKPSTPSGASSSPFAPPMMSPGNGPSGDGSGMSTASFDKPHGTHYETTQIKSGGGPVSGNYSKTLQSKRNLAEVARQAITQDYQRRLPVEYRLMTAEYFELLGSLEE